MAMELYVISATQKYRVLIVLNSLTLIKILKLELDWSFIKIQIRCRFAERKLELTFKNE